MVAESEGGRQNRARNVGMRVINTQMAKHGVNEKTQLDVQSKGKKQASTRRGAEWEEPQRGLRSMIRDRRTKSQEGGGS